MARLGDVTTDSKRLKGQLQGGIKESAEEVDIRYMSVGIRIAFSF